MVAESMTNRIKWVMPWIAVAGISGFAVGVLIGSR